MNQKRSITNQGFWKVPENTCIKTDMYIVHVYQAHTYNFKDPFSRLHMILKIQLQTAKDHSQGINVPYMCRQFNCLIIEYNCQLIKITLLIKFRCSLIGPVSLQE